MTYLNAIQTEHEIRDALRELAKKNKLSVTELLALPPKQKEMAGMLILGQVWQAVPSDFGVQLNCVNAAEYDEELQHVMVKIEGINATLDPDNPERDMLRLTVGTETKHVRASTKSAEFDQAQPMVRDKTKLIKLDSNHQAEVSLADAWLLLKQCGADCC